MMDFITRAKNAKQAAKQAASFQSQDKENTPRLPLVVVSSINASKNGGLKWGV